MMTTDTKTYILGAFFRQYVKIIILYKNEKNKILHTFFSFTVHSTIQHLQRGLFNSLAYNGMLLEKLKSNQVSYPFRLQVTLGLQNR